MATTLKTAAPKPRTIPKKAPKVCDAGHAVGPKWRPGQFCGHCHREKFLEQQAIEARAEREGWDAVLGPIPDVMVLRSGDGLSVQRFAIPRGMRPRKRGRR
jgi:hypothetical protein